MSENTGARSYKGEVIGDSMAITINFKWLLQICVLVGAIVYGFWQIEARITRLEDSVVTQNEQIEYFLNSTIKKKDPKKLSWTLYFRTVMYSEYSFSFSNF